MKVCTAPKPTTSPVPTNEHIIKAMVGGQVFTYVEKPYAKLANGDVIDLAFGLTYTTGNFGADPIVLKPKACLCVDGCPSKA